MPHLAHPIHPVVRLENRGDLPDEDGIIERA